MSTRTIGELLARCGIRTVFGIGLAVGALLAAPIGAAACTEIGAAAVLCTQEQSVDDTMVPAAGSGVFAAIGPDFNAGASASGQALSADMLRQASPPSAETGGMGVLPRAAYGAGALLMIGLLGLAGLNSRKRPLRSARTMPDRDW